MGRAVPFALVTPWVPTITSSAASPLKVTLAAKVRSATRHVLRIRACFMSTATTTPSRLPSVSPGRKTAE